MPFEGCMNTGDANCFLEKPIFPLRRGLNPCAAQGKGTLADMCFPGNSQMSLWCCGSTQKEDDVLKRGICRKFKVERESRMLRRGKKSKSDPSGLWEHTCLLVCRMSNLFCNLVLNAFSYKVLGQSNFYWKALTMPKNVNISFRAF